MDRSRFQISFDLADPWHRKAALCVEQHGRRRSEYIVACIMIAERLQEAPQPQQSPAKRSIQEPNEAVETTNLPEALRDFTKQF